MSMSNEDVAIAKAALDHANTLPHPRLENTDVLMLGDAERHCMWEFGTPDEADIVARFLREYTWPHNPKPLQYVDDPMIGGVVQEGRWRQAYVRAVPNEREDVYTVTLSLRKGYMQALDWDEARITESFRAAGNSEEITDPATSVAVDDTASDDPDRVVFFQLPNIAPESISTVDAALPATLPAATIDGEAFTGTWHKIVSHAQRDQDGSAFIDVIYAQDQFTINAYRNKNTVREDQVGYLWNVPKILAQGIIDAWASGNGRSAVPQYSGRGREKTVDIILSAAVGVFENFTSDWMQVSCDRYRRWHFGWGYTKAQMETFFDDHNTPIPGSVVGNGIADGVDETWRYVRSRQFQDQLRGDGFYDPIIIETSFGPHASPEVADWTIVLPVGEKITKTIARGYNLSSTEISSSDLQDLYDTTVTGKIGYEYTFDVTKHPEDCSFDYIATITRQIQDIEMSATVAQTDSLGVATTVESIRGATQAEIDLALAAAADKATYSRAVQVDLQARDNEIADAKITKRQVVESDAVGSHALLTPATNDGIRGGSAGEQVALRVLNNADPTSLDTDDYVTAKGKSITLDVKLDDAGAMAAVKLQRQQVEQSMGTDGTTPKPTPHGTKPVSYGDAAHKIEHIVKIGDVDADEEDLAQWVSDTGTKVAVRPTIDKTGAKSFELIITKAQDLIAVGEDTPATTSLTLSNLDPRFNRGGYKDTAYAFKACSLDNIPARSGYYFFQQLTYHTDNTFDGMLVLRAYNTPYSAQIGSAGTSQSSVGDVQLLRYGSKVYAIRPLYTITWDMAVLQANLNTSATAPAITTRVRIGKVSLYGQELWASEMWELTGWEKLNGAEWSAVAFGDNLLPLLNLT